ncbi:MAG: tetratricopeptide repeat protein [Chloroflexia bacterium]|nr:tetratricopeptide repeat protein [Chloroflexia bacterium]
MSSLPPMAADQSHAERIGQEVKAIRDMGYACDLQQDVSAQRYYLTVELARDTHEGPQPVHLYFQLDANFPATAPNLVVTVTTPGTTSHGELQELPIDVESKTRLSWSSRQMLYEIVLEVQDSVQSSNLRLARIAEPVAPRPPLDAPLPKELPPREERPLPTPTRRSATGKILAVVGGGVTLLIAGGLVLYYTLLYDPCASEQQFVAQAYTVGDRESLAQVTHTLEAMRSRGQSGVGGSCGSLVDNPILLITAYERYASALLEANQLDQAEAMFRQALALDPASSDAQAGLTAVIEARTKTLWTEAEQLWPVNTTASWAQVVTLLEQIHVLHPEAQSPEAAIGVKTRLAQAQMAWGDLLFATDVTEAHEHYVLAATLEQDLEGLADRLKWIARATQFRDASVATWPALISELEQAVQLTPNTSDPAVRTVEQWLYDSYVGYGLALLERGGAVGTDALAQANTALSLAQVAEDRGESARQLKREAEALLASTSAYQIITTRLDASEWTRLLTDRRLATQINGDPVNLLIIAPTSNLVLNLVGSSGNRQIVTDRTGVASAALPSGRYLLSLAELPMVGEANLDLSTSATYLVRIIPR